MSHLAREVDKELPTSLMSITDHTRARHCICLSRQDRYQYHSCDTYTLVGGRATPLGCTLPNKLIIHSFITPHAQRERGKVIDRGVHIYICLWSKKKFESYFRDRLTFSNIDSRTSRRIYRLALLLRAPETLSSLSKSRISIFNAHLTLLVRKMTSHNSIGKYRHLVN